MNFMKENHGKTQSLGRLFETFGVSIQENARWRDELFSPEFYLTEDSELKNVLIELKTRFRLCLLTNNTILVAKKSVKALGIDIKPICWNIENCIFWQ